MAKSALPLIALAGAAFFLLRKKDEAGTGGNGSDGGAVTEADIRKPGLYDLKVGQTYTVSPPEGEKLVQGHPFVDFNNAPEPWNDGDSYVGSIDEEKGQISFRPLKAGKFEVQIRVVFMVSHGSDGTGYDYKNIDYIFMVT